MSSKGRFVRTIGVNVNEEEDSKLKALCEQTCRNASEVVRLLIRQATIAGLSDIRLAGSVSQTELHGR